MSFNPDRCIAIPRVDASLFDSEATGATSCPVFLVEMHGIRFGIGACSLKPDHTSDLAFTASSVAGFDGWLLVRMLSPAVGELWFDTRTARSAREGAVFGSVAQNLLETVVDAIGERMILLLREEAGGPCVPVLKSCGFRYLRRDPLAVMVRLPRQMEAGRGVES